MVRENFSMPRSSDDHAVAVQSSLDRGVHAVFARGTFDALYRGYLAHATRLGPLPEERALSMMRTALGATTLQLALLPPDQYCSWTFNIDELGLNLFIAGDNTDYQVTGRIHDEHVKTMGTNRLYIETQRPRHKPARSVVDFEGLDVLEAFHQYFRRSLQMRARFIELGEEDLLLIQGLPIVDEAWFESLDVDSARRMVDSGLEPIERRLYSFGCGCDIQKINLAVHDLFADKLDELFEGQDVIDVQCPRCGRHWSLPRATVEGYHA